MPKLENLQIHFKLDYRATTDCDSQTIDGRTSLDDEISCLPFVTDHHLWSGQFVVPAAVFDQLQCSTKSVLNTIHVYCFYLPIVALLLWLSARYINKFYKNLNIGLSTSLHNRRNVSRVFFRVPYSDHRLMGFAENSHQFFLNATFCHSIH